MNLDEFRRLVIKEFGPDLDHATPANVRDFLDRMQVQELNRTRSHNPTIVLNEPGRTYEEIVKDTFARLLKLPAEEAAPLLWIIAFELSFSVVEFQYGEVFSRLFPEEL